MNIASLDLNLLRVLDALLQERSVTRAGQRLYMSQPAVSNALGRLRHTFSDDLFIRNGHGMQPTPRAAELAEPVRRALAELEMALEPVGFDPVTDPWTFRVVASDYFATVLLPPFAAHLTAHAPHVDVRVFPSVEEMEDMLDTHRADFAICHCKNSPERFTTAKLLEESYVVVMRKDHPLAAGPLTVEAYADAKHLLVAPTGELQNPIDTALLAQGLSRRIAMTVNQFVAAGPVVAESDMILTVMRRVAARFCDGGSLTAVPMPLTLDPKAGHLVWHSRLASHPAHDWFRKTITEIAATV